MKKNSVSVSWVCLNCNSVTKRAFSKKIIDLDCPKCGCGMINAGAGFDQPKNRSEWRDLHERFYARGSFYRHPGFKK